MFVTSRVSGSPFSGQAALVLFGVPLSNARAVKKYISKTRYQNKRASNRLCSRLTELVLIEWQYQYS